MDRMNKVIRLRESLIREVAKNNMSEKIEMISEEDVEEIVGDLYLQIGKLERQIMELATPREADKRNKEIKQIRYLTETMTFLI